MCPKNKPNEVELKNLDKNASDIGIGGYLAPEKDQENYQKRMQQRKEIQRERVESRSKEKGLVLVFNGNGKGKTTAAMGMALRVLGHEKKVAIIQFIKGGWSTGEANSLQKFEENLIWLSLGEGFTWETQNRDRDKKLVKNAWEKAQTFLNDENFKLVILDEINVVLKLGYLDIASVLKGLSKRPELTHVVLTGRGAPKELINHADLVTEMKLIKHPFQEQGVKAQEGIEF